MDFKINQILCSKINSIYTILICFLIFIFIKLLPIPFFYKIRLLFILTIIVFIIRIINETQIIDYLEQIPNYISLAGIVLFTGFYYNYIFYSFFNFNPILYFSLEDYTISVLKFLSIEFIILAILIISFKICKNKLYILIVSIFTVLSHYFFQYNNTIIIYVYLSLIIASSLYICEYIKIFNLNSLRKKVLSFHFIFSILYPYCYGEILKNNTIDFLKNNLKISFTDETLIHLDKTSLYNIFLNKKNNFIVIKKIEN